MASVVQHTWIGHHECADTSPPLGQSSGFCTLHLRVYVEGVAPELVNLSMFLTRRGHNNAPREEERLCFGWCLDLDHLTEGQAYRCLREGQCSG